MKNQLLFILFIFYGFNSIGLVAQEIHICYGRLYNIPNRANCFGFGGITPSVCP